MTYIRSLDPSTDRGPEEHLTDRARFGRVALATVPDYPKLDDQTCLVDLLSDLMHLAGETGLNFEAAVETAISHYAEERLEAPPQAA